MPTLLGLAQIVAQLSLGTSKFCPEGIAEIGRLLSGIGQQFEHRSKLKDAGGTQLSVVQKKFSVAQNWSELFWTTLSWNPRCWLCAPCQYVDMWAMATRWPDPAQRFIIIHGLLGLRSSTVAWQYVEFITAPSSFILAYNGDK